MTTLYRSVLIETAEQAEALPDEAIVINSSGDRYNRSPWGPWHSAADDRDLVEDLDSRNFPVTINAFVPIEAKEDVQELHGIRKTVPWGELIEITYPGINETADSRDWRRHAYWTPWEEA